MVQVRTDAKLAGLYFLRTEYVMNTLFSGLLWVQLECFTPIKSSSIHYIQSRVSTRFRVPHLTVPLTRLLHHHHPHQSCHDLIGGFSLPGTVTTGSLLGGIGPANPFFLLRLAPR